MNKLYEVVLVPSVAISGLHIDDTHDSSGLWQSGPYLLDQVQGARPAMQSDRYSLFLRRSPTGR
jgi:hypothetical protein